MYKNLLNKINEDQKAQQAYNVNEITTGFNSDTDSGLKRYLTETRFNSYKKGIISREKAIEYAIKRMEMKNEKATDIDRNKLLEVSEINKLLSLNISVEWKKSQTWGNNPTATIYCRYIDKNNETRSVRIEGKPVSGCGYDKESTAIAEVLNNIPAALKPLYDKAEENHDKDYRNLLGYGSGYGILPYFEGGVGVSCFKSIYENLGYEWECVASGKTYDAYTVRLI